MTDHIAQTIAECEAKILELGGVIEKLRWFRREFPHTAAAVEKSGDRPRRKYTRRASPANAGRKAKRPIKRTNERTNEAKDRPRVKRSRSLPDKAESQLAAIAGAVRDGVDTMAALREQLGLSNFIISGRLKILAKRGLIIFTGKTSQRRIHHVQGTSASKQPTPAPSSLDQVEARDRAVLLRIRNAGPAGRSMRELMISMTDESEESLEKSLERLRIKKAIRADGDKWVAA